MGGIAPIGDSLSHPDLPRQGVLLILASQDVDRGRQKTLETALRIFVIMFVGALSAFAMHNDQAGNRWFDVFDEGAHFDYVVKLSHGHIPAWGDTYDQETMLISTCLGSALVVTTPNCEVVQRDPSSFAAGGFSYEAQQPPLGYLPYLPGLATAPTDDPERTLNHVRDVGGIILLLLACVLLFAMSSIFRLRWWSTVVLSAGVLLAPISVHALSTVSNDGATLVAALLFVAALGSTRWLKLGQAVVAGVLVGLVLGGTKLFMLLLPAGLLVAYFFLDWVFKGRGRPTLRSLLGRSDVAFSLSSAFSTMVVALVFTLGQSVRSIVPAGDVLGALLGFKPRVDSVQPYTIVSSVANLSNGWLGNSNGLMTGEAIFLVANAIVLIGIGFSSRRAFPRLLIVSWCVTIIFFSVAWPVLLFLQGHFDFDAPSRYGLILLPLSITAVALALNGSRSRAGDVGP